MRSVRLFLLGGLISYRALFNWLNPWILVPTFILSPLFQILLFAYIGRTASVGSDEFFLIGNAVQYAAIPCLFAMGSTIEGERQWGTLPLLLVSPARRIPLFLGRALPVILNAIGVAVVGLAGGALLLRVYLGHAAGARVGDRGRHVLLHRSGPATGGDRTARP
jgi:ABC-2 type transport system permease protein